MRKKVKNITVKIITLAILLMIVSLALISCSLKYAWCSTVIENNIEYQLSFIFDDARVSEIILTKEETNIVIEIPEQLNGGEAVEGIGFATKGEDFFDFALKGEKITYCSESELEGAATGSVVTDYYVLIKFGDNIEDADSWVDINTWTYKLNDKDEYIRVNVIFEVTSNNQYYYSENGILKEK